MSAASTASPDPEDLRIFMWVARLASFTRAAEQLQQPRATVSNAVQRLEEKLGARLLQRTTRRVQVTRAGEELLERCERVLEDLDEIGALFQRRGAPLRGRLRVDMPLGMASGMVMARLPDFLDGHPELQVDVFSTDRRVDVVGEGFDLVVRAGAVVDESLAYRPLPSFALRNVASPAYVEKYGLPRTIADLAVHWLVNYQPNPGAVPAAFEYADPLGGQTLHLPMRHRVTVNNGMAYDAACRAGFGIAQMPALRATGEIAAGLLVEVMPDFPPAPMAMHILFPHRRNIPQRVRAFADWIVAVLQEAVPPAAD